MADYLPGWPEEWKKQPGDPAGWDPDQWVYPQQLRGEEVATTGGLAQVVMDRGEDDDTPLMMELPDTAGMRSMANAPESDSPEDASSALLKRRRMNRDDAIASLRQARQDILARKADPSAKWWALAQGMLAPTKTGSFGESLGVTAGLMGQERRESREAEIAQMEQIRDIQEQERAVEEDLLRAEERMQAEQRRRDEAEQTLEAGRGHPFDRYTDVPQPDGTTKRELVRSIIKRDEDGNEYVEDVRDLEGNLAIRPDRLSPDLQYLLASAKALGGLEPGVLEKKVSAAEVGKQKLARVLHGLTLLDELDAAGEQATGGIQGIIQRFRSFFGDEAQDVTDRGTLMNLMAFQLFEMLSHFGTQINTKELQISEQLSAGINQSAGVNRQLLQNLVRDAETTLNATNVLVQHTGTERHKMRMAVPMTNYGLGEKYVERLERRGFQLEDYAPFEDAAAPATEEGAVGTQSSPIPVNTDRPTYHQVPKGKWFTGPGGTFRQN